MKLIQRVTILPILVVLAGPGLALGQRASGTQATQAAPVEFQIVRLKYVKASETVGLLQTMFVMQIGLVADERTNSLLIRATAPRVAEIREVLKRIDIEGADTEIPDRIKVFELRSLEADKSLENALRLVIRKSPNANFAVDKTRKTVVISADKRTTEAVEALLARLDLMGTNRPDEEMQVRVVWLVNDPGKEVELEVGHAPSNDLKDVLPGLAKLGIDQPRVVAQLLVNTQPNSRFQVKGETGLYNVRERGEGRPSYLLSASGRLNSRTPPPGLEISIQVKNLMRSVEESQIQTEISAPPGHLVVLGVTPIYNMSSAFVVQVLPKERKQPAPRK
jgi:hypothetical protein